jgi:hypothetical protein
VYPADYLDPIWGDVLCAQLRTGGVFEFCGDPAYTLHGGRFEVGFHGLLPHGRGVCESDAEGGQDTGHGRYEHSPDTEKIGYRAGVLPARATEGRERVLGDIMALLNGDLLDRIGHVGDGDLQEALRHLLRHSYVTGCLSDFGGEFSELVPHHLDVEGLIAGAAEDGRKMLGLNPPQHDVRVRDGQRATVPVARGTRVGAG